MKVLDRVLEQNAFAAIHAQAKLLFPDAPVLVLDATMDISVASVDKALADQVVAILKGAIALGAVDDAMSSRYGVSPIPAPLRRST